MADVILLFKLYSQKLAKIKMLETWIFWKIPIAESIETTNLG